MLLYLPRFKMKLSTIKWLSKTIALPLFMGILNIAPADAGQIDRSRSSAVDLLPSVTDLNLLVPVTASPLPSDLPEPATSIEPIWSNPTRKSLSIPINKDRTNKAKAASRQGGVSTISTSFVPPLTGEKSNRIDITTRQKNSPGKSVDTSISNALRDNRRSRSGSRKDIAAISKPPLSGNYLRLVRDPNNATNDVGNPIYILEAYVRGERYQTFTTVSGTARSQTADRNRGDNAAPLPDGSYRVSSQVVAGVKSEVGKTFIGVYPEFKTARTDLGIHLDPSFNQTNGYDGTAGCIGIATVAERDAINDFVTKYRPQNLLVKIGF
jgi:hypothetical protein